MAHNLKVGDLSVFELITAIELMLKFVVILAEDYFTSLFRIRLQILI